MIGFQKMVELVILPHASRRARTNIRYRAIA